jgi:hypothetical protein
MTARLFAYRGLTGTLTVMLVACGGSQATIGSPNAVQPAVKHQTQGQYLMYVAGGGSAGEVVIYTYPGGAVAGRIQGLNNPYGECLDSSNNVWVVTNNPNTVTEYPQGGGTKPIASLGVPGNSAFGCAVDPGTGNLAVSTDQGVSIFPNASGQPTSYTDVSEPGFLAYDDSGNLFAIAGGADLTELPAQGSGFIKLKVSQTFKKVGIQWNGSSLYVAGEGHYGKAPLLLYQLSVSGNTATVTRIIHLYSLVQRPNLAEFFIIVHRIVQPTQGGTQVGSWAFPTGGEPLKTFKSRGVLKDDSYGIVVSETQ